MKVVEVNGFYFEVPDSNNIEEKCDSFGNLKHEFQIFEAEPFNLNRKRIYEYMDVMVDGDVICHKNWLKLDKNLDDLRDRDCNLKVNWDPRIYIVVKSFDGKGYAVTFNDRFFMDFVNNYEENKNINEVPEKRIIPIEDLSDDYVLIQTNSNLMKCVADCSDMVITENDRIITCGVDVYGIKYEYLFALRLIAIIYSLGYDDVVLTYSDPRLKEYLLSAFYRVSEFKTKYRPEFIGHYEEGKKGLLLCREEIAKKYEKNGFLLLNVNSLISNCFDVYIEEKGIERKRKNDKY